MRREIDPNDLRKHRLLVTPGGRGIIVKRSVPALDAVTISATLIALALWPLFTAMLLASANAETRLGVAALYHGALDWYGRALRLWLVSLVPLGLAFATARLLSKAAVRHAEGTIFESRGIEAWCGGGVRIAR